MHCKNCGQQLMDGSVFCTNCGTKVANNAATTRKVPSRNVSNDAAVTRQLPPNAGVNQGYVVNPSANMAPAYSEAYAANATSGNGAAPAGKKPSNKKPAIIAAVIALVVIIAAVACFLVINNQNQHKKYDLAIAVALEQSAGLTSTPVPVSIEGTDFEGHAVSERYLASSDTSNCPKLERGTYKVTIAGSPILSDGSLCKYDTSTIVVEITENSDNNVVLPSPTAMPVADTTIEQVQQAYTTLVDYGMSADEAKTYKDAAEKRITEYQAKVAAEKKAAEEAAAAQKAAEEAAAQAAAEAAAAAAAKYETGASNVKLTAKWFEYVYGNTEVVGSYGARVSVDLDANELIVEIGGSDQPLSEGTHYYKIADNVTCRLEGNTSTLSNIASSLKSCYSQKSAVGYGPMTTGHSGRSTAYQYGAGGQIVFETQIDGQVTSIRLVS